MNINEQINEYIESKGIKQVHVAQITGLSPNTVSKILNGNRRILADEFLTICTALNIDPNVFRGERTGDQKTA